MLLAVIAVQIVILLLLLVMLARGPRLDVVPDSLAALGTKIEALDSTLRNNVSELRYEQGKAAQDARTASDKASRELREEINGSIDRVATALNVGLAAFRTENSLTSDKLRETVLRDLGDINDRLQKFFAEAAKRELDAATAQHASLSELTATNTASAEKLRDSLQRSLSSIGQEQREAGEKLRATVESGLRTLNTDNAAKLDEMRVIVDEKLQKTLADRLTSSFGQVTTHLGEVQKGLGEMKELASGVNDLRRVFSNVKARGGIGEVQLGMLLEQMFSPEQYLKNVEVVPNSRERVEYALKIPQTGSTALLPIDSKFPQEDWTRLEQAYEVGGEELVIAGRNFERAIRIQAKKICEKYISEPATLPQAIMFLPTEALYGEVTRRAGLQESIQQTCNVTIAGPSTFAAILTSFRMGFHLLMVQEKGSEVWEILKETQKEFEKFGGMMDTVQKQVGTVQNTLKKIGGKTKTINRALKTVSRIDQEISPATLFAEEAGSEEPFMLAAMAADDES